ncbi:MAG: porphobilinogen synthase, partial [Acidimicrobiales bacterium]|nr:porphobilinogen synthase [Acidimicrobiales bacterium]
MSFPARRLRRLRRTPALRRMVAETQLSTSDLIAPLFVREGVSEPVPVSSLPGVAQHTLGSLRKE